MDFINSPPSVRKRSLLAAAVPLIVALVIAGFLCLTGSSGTNMAAPTVSEAQSAEEDPQSNIPQSVTRAITPQSGGSANESSLLAADAEATGQVTFVMNILWDTHTSPKQARATNLSSVLTTSALEEFDVQTLEWTKDGTHATGLPILEDAHILNDDGAGNTIVSACVDSSSVRVLNDAGTALTDDTTVTRTLTHFLSVRDDNAWRLSGFSFPDDPTC